MAVRISAVLFAHRQTVELQIPKTHKLSMINLFLNLTQFRLDFNQCSQLFELYHKDADAMQMVAYSLFMQLNSYTMLPYFLQRSCLHFTATTSQNRRHSQRSRTYLEIKSSQLSTLLTYSLMLLAFFLELKFTTSRSLYPASALRVSFYRDTFT